MKSPSGAARSRRGRDRACGAAMVQRPSSRTNEAASAPEDSVILVSRRAFATRMSGSRTLKFPQGKWGQKGVEPQHGSRPFTRPLTRTMKSSPLCRAFPMARPGLEPGTPRFSAARPPRANVPVLQRNCQRVLRRRVRGDSRTFVAIAALSGTRSRTCAQMTSETQLPAAGHPGVARSARRGVRR
jgi:hypothetical protein